MSPTTSFRKIFQSIGHYGPALGCVWLAFVGCNQTVSVIALCVAVGLNGAVFSGYQVSDVHLSISRSLDIQGRTKSPKPIPYTRATPSRFAKTSNLARTSYVLGYSPKGCR